MTAGVSPGCLKACRAGAPCAGGWPDGSCGAGFPQGALCPARVPPHLDLRLVRAFEWYVIRDRQIYHDWCLDNGWPERAAELEAGEGGAA